MSESPSLYDRVLTGLKNNPVTAGVFLLSALTLGVAQLLGGVSAIKQHLFGEYARYDVALSVQPFTLLGQEVQPARPVGPLIGSPREVDQLAAGLAAGIEQLTAAAGLARVTLRIDQGRLLSSQAVVASIYTMGNMAAQTAPLREDVDLSAPVPLEPIFDNPLLYRPRCQCIHLALSDPGSTVRTAEITIHRGASGFGFRSPTPEPPDTGSGSPAVHTSVTLPFEVWRNIVNLSPCTTISSETPERVFARDLDRTLAALLSKSPGLQVSTRTRAQLDDLRRLYQQQGHSRGKQELMEQEGVDFIVSCTITPR